MLIKIDFRETDLMAACEKVLQLPDYVKINETKAVKIMACSLPLGDIIICEEKEEEKEKVLIERKTLEDLAASIRDGRYAEQSFRLNECSLHNHHIFYAIEGDLRNYKSTHFSKNKIDKKALLSAMTSIHYYKGFSIMRTMNVLETAEWIIQMADKIQREQVKNKAVPYYSFKNTIEKKELITADALPDALDEKALPDALPDALPEQGTYVNVLKNKRIKKDNITPQNIGEIMLAQIPGVSVNVAIAIMKKFGTLHHLLDVLKQPAEISPLKDLVILENEDSAKKPQKINKTSIANIYKYLL
jgi:ERCC4-type nuclease